MPSSLHLVELVCFGCEASFQVVLSLTICIIYLKKMNYFLMCPVTYANKLFIVSFTDNNRDFKILNKYQVLPFIVRSYIYI